MIQSCNMDWLSFCFLFPLLFSFFLFSLLSFLSSLFLLVFLFSFSRSFPSFPISPFLFPPLSSLSTFSFPSLYPLFSSPSLLFPSSSLLLPSFSRPLLLFQYLERLELAPVFMSEEEIAHWFLPRPDIVTCYVVEVRTHGVFGGGGKEKREAKAEKERGGECVKCAVT